MLKPRPGGRSARIKSAVFDAANALLAARAPSELTMVDIAQEAGVAATSLYRRWGNVEALLMDVATDRLMRESPLPNTGSLRGDLVTWAKSISASLASRDKSVFVRVLVASIDKTDSNTWPTALILRGNEINSMLDRARQRGEPAPQLAEIIDYLLAPLYFRMLLGAPEDEDYATALVDRLLR